MCVILVRNQTGAVHTNVCVCGCVNTCTRTYTPPHHLYAYQRRRIYTYTYLHALRNSRELLLSIL